ncbi:S8 family serine peptidase [Ideonella paludis]|uniref:S8 family serine peptidase n=2 Tax=Ideonella paludis TaxID=1233411 RepID=A0ABS5DYT1_9BURK|nr:S8 family serine peptidase [Ideonella paludis]
MAERPRAMSVRPEGKAAEPTHKEVIVLLRDGIPSSSPQLLNQVLAEGRTAGYSLRYVADVAVGGWVIDLGKAAKLADVEALSRHLASKIFSVVVVEPNHLVFPTAIPNDPMLVDQWSFGAASSGGTNVLAGWDSATGADAVVAVLDTGSIVHEEFAGREEPGYDFVSSLVSANDKSGRDADPADPGDWTDATTCATKGESSSTWHGARVASTIGAAANNAAGVAGIAYNSRVMHARVLGRCGGSASDVADAIVWAAGVTGGTVPAPARPARVLNLSFGLALANGCSAVYQRAVDSALKAGVLVVAGAGNDNSNVAFFSPGSCNGVMSVAALGRAGNRASYSNFGARVDVSAPVGDHRDSLRITAATNLGASSPQAPGYMQEFFGTSAATPHVSGVAALMLEANPALLPHELGRLLRNSASPFISACDNCGSGVVDGLAAVQAARAIESETQEGESNGGKKNDSKSSAQVLTAIPSRVKGSLQSATDIDFYRVDVPAGQKVRVVVASLLPVDMDVAVSGGKFTQLAVRGASGMVDYVDLTNSTTSTQVANLRVSQVGATTAGYPLSYALRAIDVPAPARSPVVTNFIVSQASAGQPVQGSFNVNDADGVSLKTLRVHVGTNGAAGSDDCYLNIDPQLGTKQFQFNGSGISEGAGCAQLLPSPGQTKRLYFWIEAVDHDQFIAKPSYSSVDYLGGAQTQVPLITAFSVNQATAGSPMNGSFNVADADSNSLRTLRVHVGDQGSAGTYGCFLDLDTALGLKSFSFSGSGTSQNGQTCAGLIPLSGQSKTLWFKVEAVDPDNNKALIGVSGNPVSGVYRAGGDLKPTITGLTAATPITTGGALSGSFTITDPNGDQVTKLRVHASYSYDGSSCTMDIGTYSSSQPGGLKSFSGCSSYTTTPGTVYLKVEGWDVNGLQADVVRTTVQVNSATYSSSQPGGLKSFSGCSSYTTTPGTVYLKVEGWDVNGLQADIVRTTVQVNATMGTVSGRTPDTLTRNVSTRVTVTGSGFPATAVFAIDNVVCNSDYQRTGTTSISQTCIAQPGTPSTTYLRVKDGPGGSYLSNGNGSFAFSVR